MNHTTLGLALPLVLVGVGSIATVGFADLARDAHIAVIQRLLDEEGLTVSESDAKRLMEVSEKLWKSRSRNPQYPVVFAPVDVRSGNYVTCAGSMGIAFPRRDESQYPTSFVCSSGERYRITLP